MGYNNDNMISLNSLFKKSYADKVADFIPDNTIISRRVPAVSYESTPGGIYEVPVIVTRSTGATKAPANVDIFALNPPISLGVKSGQIEGSQFISRMAFSYEALSRSENSPNKFESVTKAVVKSHLQDAYFYQELDCLYGKSTTGIGIISAVTGTSFTITLASFAPAIWIGNDTKVVIFENSANTVLKGSATLSAVDVETRTMTVDAMPVGVGAGDIVRWEADGLAGVNSFMGLQRIATATGTLFNISTAYSMWKPIGAVSLLNNALSFQKIMTLLNKPVSRGLGSVIRECEAYCSIAAFSSLTADMAALRRADYSYKSDTSEIGTEHIEYYSQAGSMKIIPHAMVKEADFFIVPKIEKVFQKIGSQSTPTFNLPGQQRAGGANDVYLFPIPNMSGVEARLYYNTSLFTTTPHQILYVNGIVNPTV